MGYPLWENVNFCSFRSFCFCSLESRFFFLNMVEDILLVLYFPKIKVEKMAIFGAKPWVIPVAKMSIFRRFELFAFIA